jgi:hypothetical protein
MKAILSKTTSDMHKSKLMSPFLVQLVLDVYMTPQEYAELITKYDSKDFEIEIR